MPHHQVIALAGKTLKIRRFFQPIEFIQLLTGRWRITYF
jgi:hypothetical protein